MNKLGLFVIVVVFSLSGFQPVDKKTRKAIEQLEMSQLIELGRYRFIARSANSDLGSFNNLSSSYDLVIDSLHVKAFLPYYGRAYSVPYGGTGGVKFDLIAKQIKTSWNERRKLYTITTELIDNQDSYSIQLTTGLDGYADLKIDFRNRKWISYHGTIERITLKK